MLAMPHDPGPLRDMLAWADPRFGPLYSFTGVELRAPHPRWWVYSGQLARYPAGNWFGGYPAGAAGVSLDPNHALRSALGEAAERYSALNVDLGEHVFRQAVGDDPWSARYPKCAADEPCPPSMRGLSPYEVIDYVPVRQAWDGCPTSLPRVLVDLAYTPPVGEPLVALAISTGLAFHPQLDVALWKGLAEVIERDAMMIMWWTRSSPRELDLEAPVPAAIRERRHRLARVGIRPRLFEITTDLRFPTVFCVLEGRSYPRFTVGASTSESLERAMCKAIDEAVGVRLTVQQPIELPSVEQFDWVTQLDHHVALYADPRMDHAFDFLLEARVPHSFDELEDQEFWSAPADIFAFAALAQQLRDRGLTVFWTDVTVPEVANLGRTVKVVVPEAVPLSQAHAARWLACPRLLAAAGLSHGAHVAAFNPYPHPFA
jgi:ribosomal protein S12 methylthiotransferase accessory factor